MEIARNGSSHSRARPHVRRACAPREAHSATVLGTCSSVPATRLPPHPTCGVPPPPGPAQVYGEGYGTHLNALARDSALVAQLMDSQLLEPFRRSLHKSPMAIWFDAAERANLPLFFWREARRAPAPHLDTRVARCVGPHPGSPWPPHRHPWMCSGLGMSRAGSKEPRRPSSPPRSALTVRVGGSGGRGSASPRATDGHPVQLRSAPQRSPPRFPCRRR
eukprot:scaffold24680_cov221-Isochrysis_galbana.AAC.6